MPELARRYSSNYSDYRQSYTPRYERPMHTVHPMPVRRTVNEKKVKRNYLIHKIISVAFVSLLGLSVLPIGFNKVTKGFFNPTPYKNIKADCG